MSDSATNRRELRRQRAILRAQRRANVTLSHHALKRAAELGFHALDVFECVENPEQTYCCHPKYGPNRIMFQRRDCACVVDGVSAVVVTVLLRRSAPWVHGLDARYPGAA